MVPTQYNHILNELIFSVPDRATHIHVVDNQHETEEESGAFVENTIYTSSTFSSLSSHHKENFGTSLAGKAMRKHYFQPLSSVSVWHTYKA